MKARKKGSNNEWQDIAYVQLENSDILYKKEYLEFDTLSTELKTNSQIANEAHWQDVRERVAIAAMQGLSANPNLVYDNSEEKINIIARAMRYADKLVEQLKNIKQ